jgi:PAS domain S-box-containing protein
VEAGPRDTLLPGRLLRWGLRAIPFSATTVAYVDGDSPTRPQVTVPYSAHTTAIGFLADEMGLGFAVVDRSHRCVFINTAMEAVLGQTIAEVIGNDLSAVIGPQQAAEYGALIDRVRRSGAPVRGVLTDHNKRRWESTFAPIDLADGSAVGIITADVTERDLGRVSAHSRALRQDALVEFSLAALIADDLQVLLDSAVALLARVLGFELACVLGQTFGHEGLSMRAGVGFQGATDSTVVLPEGRATLARYTVSVGEPVIVTDLATETRFSRSGLLLDNGVRSGISLPIRVGETIWGVLQALARTARAVSDEEVFVLRMIADILGAAVARAVAVDDVTRLLIQRRRLIHQAVDASEGERRRIADLLHDDVLQHLLFVRQERLSAPPASAAADDRIDASLTTAIGLLRSLISDLHPVLPAHRGLSDTIASLVAAVGERTELTITTRFAGEPSSRHDQLVAWAIRELLNNIERHAHASAVHLTIVADDSLVVEVADDGRGLDPSAITRAVREGHIGLVSLIERVEADDGHVEFTTPPGQVGALVRFTLPLP